MNNIAVDFHMHSTASDGALAPEELAYLLHELGILYAALTDHDTMFWVERMMSSLKTIGSKLELFPWVEITTHYKQKTLHLLAYGMDSENTELADFLTRQKDARRDRAVQIMERLNTLLENERKKVIPIEEILALETEWPITRPDIARYLIENKYVKTHQEAFDRWLIQCDVPLQTTNIFDTTRFVRDIWWVPILAHAFAPWISLNSLTKEVSEQFRILMELKASWLQWVETYYQGHEFDTGLDWISSNIAIADSLKLTTTGGSDFHGGGKWAAPLPWITMPERRVDGFLELLHR